MSSRTTPEPSHSSTNAVEAFLQTFAQQIPDDPPFGGGDTDSTVGGGSSGPYHFPPGEAGLPVLPSSSSTIFPPLSTGSSTSQELKSLVRVLKNRTEFTEKAQRDIDNFVEALETEQRLLNYCALVEIRDILKEQQKEKSDKFVMSDKLKESIKVYTRAFLLSPKLSAYRGNNAEMIMAVLRELELQGLPPPQEIGANQDIKKAIGVVLTNFRSTMKEKIKASMETAADGTESDLQNIATLTFALASQCHVRVTMRHYMRIAFLRWATKMHKDVADESFWGTVDKTMEGMRSKLVDETAITNALKQTYEQDKMLYGKPEDTECRVVDIARVPDWQNVVDKHAKEVMGLGKKRKRV